MTFSYITTKAEGSAARNILSGNNDQSFNSLEQFLTPVQIQKNHPRQAAMPGFRSSKVGNEDSGMFGIFDSSPDEGAVGPTIHELDPYFPIGNLGGRNADDGSKFFEKNDFISVASNATNSFGGPQLNLSAFSVDGGDLKTVNTVRINALRGPLIMSGWGYGSDDTPEPQKGGHWPENYEFHPDTANDRTKWKTGPVHLMWDSERQVWHGGPRVVCGVVIGEIEAGNICEPTSFQLKLLRNTRNQLKGGDMTDDTGETITVKNRDPSLEQAKIENQIFCMAIKINYEWLPLWVGCPDTPACGISNQPLEPICLESECEDPPP